MSSKNMDAYVKNIKKIATYTLSVAMFATNVSLTSFGLSGNPSKIDSEIDREEYMTEDLDINLNRRIGLNEISQDTDTELSEKTESETEEGDYKNNKRDIEDETLDSDESEEYIKGEYPYIEEDIDTEIESEIVQAMLALSGKLNNDEYDRLMEYNIYTAEDLYKLAYDVNAGNIKRAKICLQNDIEVDRDLVPIGTKNHPFEGVFYGGEHTISGVKMSFPEEDNIGIFGYIGYDGKVLDLNISNSLFVGNLFVGSICGYIEGLIKGCNNIMSNDSEVVGDKYVGGLVGFNEGAVRNCVNNFKLKGNDYIGGNIGVNKGVIMFCGNNNEIEGRLYLGGNVGYNYNLVAQVENDGKIKGNSRIGGNIGYNEGLLSGARNNKNVFGNYIVGGNVGQNSNETENIKNNGEVISENNFYVGENIGFNENIEFNEE